LEEDLSVSVVMVSVISNRLPTDPLWIMLTGASSAGKSELIQAVDEVQGCWNISTLTPNTFLSGAKGTAGSDTSLLHRIRSGVIVMKDFTSILAMKRDVQSELMGQFREMYDGAMVKETGHGVTLKWKGKINLLAGATEKIYLVEELFAEMGSRWLNFRMPDQDRIKTTRVAAHNTETIRLKRKKLKELTNKFIAERFEVIDQYFKDGKELPELDERVFENIIHIANLASLARSPVGRNHKGVITTVFSSEMPMRMAGQMKTAAMGFYALKDFEELTPKYELAVYRLGLDSIPINRRKVLRILASYNESTTAGVATKMNLPTESARSYLQDLNAHKVIERIKSTGGGDKWKIKDEYRPIFINFDGVKRVEEDLQGEDDAVEGDAYSGYGYQRARQDLVENAVEIEEHNAQVNMEWEEELAQEALIEYNDDKKDGTLPTSTEDSKS
jgi:hypothetical protein